MGYPGESAGFTKNGNEGYDGWVKPNNWYDEKDPYGSYYKKLKKDYSDTERKEKETGEAYNYKKQNIVADMQRSLNNLGYKDNEGKELTPDGILGNKTRWVQEKYEIDTNPKAFKSSWNNTFSGNKNNDNVFYGHNRNSIFDYGDYKENGYKENVFNHDYQSQKPNNFGNFQSNDNYKWQEDRIDTKKYDEELAREVYGKLLLDMKNAAQKTVENGAWDLKKKERSGIVKENSNDDIEVEKLTDNPYKYLQRRDVEGRNQDVLVEHLIEDEIATPNIYSNSMTDYNVKPWNNSFNNNRRISLDKNLFYRSNKNYKNDHEKAKKELNKILDRQYPNFKTVDIRDYDTNLYFNQPIEKYFVGQNMLGTIADKRLEKVFEDIDNNKASIIAAEKEFGIPKEVIASVILKEGYTRSIPDWLANATTTLGKKIPLLEGNIGKVFGEHTTGLGAILPNTARKSWQNYLGKEKTEQYLPKDDLMLQYNIEEDDDLTFVQ